MEEEEDVGWEMGSGGGGGVRGCGAVFHSKHVAAGCVRSITQTQSDSATRSSPENRQHINQ